MTERIYTVRGMVCDHCAEAVGEELEGIAGVTAVNVDVDSGTVVITSDEALDTANVRAAIEEAGYELSAEGS
ncbi:heavy metal-associated domain-containing protein [Streptomyces coelicoflavus]|uniref:heavy-metal-associated domain-containing protein n=1 Tax=Streptomyces coelicoflavus TaxID=285562 RepID=UPI002E26CED8